MDPPRTNWPALAAVYFGSFVNFFNRNGMRQSLLPLYGGMMLGLPPGTIGAILTAGSVLTIVINLPGGAAADRIGRKQLLIPGMLIACTGNLIFLSGDSQLAFAAATVLISMGILANSMQSGLVADLVPESLIGKGIGMYRFTADLGSVLGPVVLGLLVDHYGFGAASLFGAAAVVLGILVCQALVPRRTGALRSRAAGDEPSGVSGIGRYPKRGG